jgi:hypothetical protein
LRLLVFALRAPFSMAGDLKMRRDMEVTTVHITIIVTPIAVIKNDEAVLCCVIFVRPLQPITGFLYPVLKAN